MGSLYITRPKTKDYVPTRERLTAVIDAAFEMYADKTLEVLIGPSYALKDAAELTEISRVASPPGNFCFLSGVEHGAKENQNAYSKRTPEIQNGPARNRATSPRP